MSEEWSSVPKTLGDNNFLSRILFPACQSCGIRMKTFLDMQELKHYNALESYWKVYVNKTRNTF